MARHWPAHRPVRTVAFDERAGAIGSAPWHQDRVIAVRERVDAPGFANWSRKERAWPCEPPEALLRSMLFLRVHLDRSDEDTGAMEIAPGTHRAVVPAGGATHVARANGAEPCRAEPGDVLVLPMLTLHRSRPSASARRRRVLRLDMADMPLPAALAWMDRARRWTPPAPADTGGGMTDAATDGLSLRFDALTIAAGDLVLARDLSGSVAAGGALVVTGPNGSGKSTLLRTLYGLHRAEAGSVALVHGARDVPLAENAHLLGHGNAMKDDLTVRENLAFWARALPQEPGGPDALIEEAAGPLGLERLLDHPFHYLSAGQRRRVALARLWVAPRPLWLLDEPTAALDAASEIAVREMIEAHRAEGGMVVAATHVDLGLADAATLVLGEAAG